jgi:hypothetical protein
MTNDVVRMVGRAAGQGPLACVWVLALLFSSWACAAQAQSFSAEIVTRRDDSSVRVGKISSLEGRVRIETIEFPDGFFLIDTAKAKPSAYFVRPAVRVYMDAKQSSRLTQWFVPVDPDAPCLQWQAMTRLSGKEGEGEWYCERTGEETIDGRSAVVFRVSTAAGQSYSGWIDRDRKFPLRIKTEDDVLLTLEEIKDDPPPASSFELPSGYGKFSPEGLIERIKQSDVWVSEPDEAKASRP